MSEENGDLAEARLAQAAEAEAPEEAPHWLRRAWRSFNRWRKTRWPLRLFILLLVFGLPVYDRVTGRRPIVKLTRIACHAILQPGQAKLSFYIKEHYEFREKKRLQRLLREHVDWNRDGELSRREKEFAAELGLKPESLYGPGIEADLDSLIEAAHGTHLVPLSHTSRRVRMDAMFLARNRAEWTFRAPRREIKRLLDQAQQWPDYGRWETWRRGTFEFVGRLVAVPFAIAPPRTLLSWLVLCFAAAMATCRLVRGRRQAVGFSLGVFLAALALLGLEPRIQWGHQWGNAVALACASGMAGIYAARVARVWKNRLRPALAAGLTIGLTFLVWGLVVRASKASGDYAWLLRTGHGLLWLPVSHTLKSVAVLAGQLLTLGTTAVVLGLSMPRLRGLRPAARLWARRWREHAIGLLILFGMVTLFITALPMEVVGPERKLVALPVCGAVLLSLFFGLRGRRSAVLVGLVAQPALAPVLLHLLRQADLSEEAAAFVSVLVSLALLAEWAGLWTFRTAKSPPQDEADR